MVGREGGTGTYNLTGGTFTAATGQGTTEVGSAAGSTGTLSVSGTGVLNSTRDGAGMIVGNGWTGTGTATGTLNVADAGVVNLGTQALTMGVATGSVVGNATVNLNGGTIQAGSVVTNGTGNTSTFNFNGGILQATATNATFMTGLTQANVRNGGAIFDTHGFDVTVGQALLHSTIAGDAAIDGGLTKNGAGMLTLTAANIYTGATRNNAGTLVISATGSINASNLVLVNAGTLTLQNTAVLSDTGTLSLLAGTTLNLDAPAGSNELIGMLVLNGVTQPAGTYTIAQLNARPGGVIFAGINNETLTVAVPEPSTWVIGLVLLVGWSQRRRVQSS